MNKANSNIKNELRMRAIRFIANEEIFEISLVQIKFPHLANIFDHLTK